MAMQAAALDNDERVSRKRTMVKGDPNKASGIAEQVKDHDFSPDIAIS
jgi:hypothetical protein